jgi:hypothetical protein
MLTNTFTQHTTQASPSTTTYAIMGFSYSLATQRRLVFVYLLALGVTLCTFTPLWQANSKVVSPTSLFTTPSSEFWFPPLTLVEENHNDKYSIISPHTTNDTRVVTEQSHAAAKHSTKIIINRAKWLKYKQRWHKNRPKLTDLIVDTREKITGDVRPLLDFAILGHAKCATSFLMQWLAVHPEVQIWKEEVCDLYDRQPAGLVSRLYKELAEGGQYNRGFKCPGHFSRRSLSYFQKYFPRTHLIVGLRHPIRWFER